MFWISQTFHVVCFSFDLDSVIYLLMTMLFTIKFEEFCYKCIPIVFKHLLKSMSQAPHSTPIYIHTVRSRDENNMNKLISIIPGAIEIRWKYHVEETSCTRNYYYLHHMFTTTIIIVQSTEAIQPNTASQFNIETIIQQLTQQTQSERQTKL